MNTQSASGNNSILCSFMIHGVCTIYNEWIILRRNITFDAYQRTHVHQQLKYVILENVDVMEFNCIQINESKHMNSNQTNGRYCSNMIFLSNYLPTHILLHWISVYLQSLLKSKNGTTEIRRFLGNIEFSIVLNAPHYSSFTIWLY